MNPLRGEATLQAGENAYTLICDINALCEAEAELGMDIDQLLASYSSGTSVRLVRGLIWAALQPRHPCTIERAGEIIAEAGFMPAKAALEKALLLAMPEPQEDKSPKKAAKGRAGTG